MKRVSKTWRHLAKVNPPLYEDILSLEKELAKERHLRISEGLNLEEANIEIRTLKEELTKENQRLKEKIKLLEIRLKNV